MAAADYSDLRRSIRLGETGDLESGVALAIEAGLFEASAIAPVRELLERAAALTPAEDRPLWLVAGPGADPTGLACAQPLPATDSTWDLTMIAVRPSVQRKGVGSALLNAVEARLRATGARLMLVQTSSSETHSGARAFYLTRGYDEEARVRDHWEDGDHMVLFRKRLS